LIAALAVRGWLDGAGAVLAGAVKLGAIEPARVKPMIARERRFIKRRDMG
jgi:hypothetical protein